MVFLDGTVVNVALPRIQSDLAVPLSGLQWIVDAYALFLAALLLVGGALGDIYGRKRVFLAGLTIFTVASIACGLAPDSVALIAARAVQGIGGALLVPGSLAMIKATIQTDDAGRAIGLWAGLSGIIAAVGPLVGGYLVSAVSWRLIFFINVPLGVITALASIRHVPETRDERASKHLDWLGSFLAVFGLGGLTFGLIQGPESGWASFLVLASLAIGSLGIILFLWIESASPNPIFPLPLFRSANFSGSNLATLGVYFSFSGAFLFLVLKLQQVQGYTPLEAGAALLPLTVLLLALSSLVGSQISRFGARLLMTVGAGAVALAFALIGFTGSNAPYWTQLFPPIILLGLGMCLFITPLTATVMGAVPTDQVGAASGINNTVSRVAGLLAVAILGIVVVAGFQSSLKSKLSSLGIPSRAKAQLITRSPRLADDPIPRYLGAPERRKVLTALRASYIEGFRWAMLTCAGLCLLSSLASYLLIRSEPATLTSPSPMEAPIVAPPSRS